MFFLFQLLIGLALNILAALLMPQPEQEQPEIQELEDPTSEPGKPVPVVFGEVLIKAPNLLEWQNNGWRERKIPLGGGKK
jgi:hypothetical protein